MVPERVIGYGATRLVVPGNFPIGCFPVYLTKYQTNDSTAYDELHCLKELNNFSIYHNYLLQQAIAELKEEHPDETVVYGDYYNAFLWLLSEADLLGFDPISLQKACCGIGGDYNYGLSSWCGDPKVPVCENPNERLSWDGVHLTQRAYELMATWLVLIQHHCKKLAAELGTTILAYQVGAEIQKYRYAKTLMNGLVGMELI
ncbi:GDSL esterase/lipase At5g03980-like [Gossypium hirsutum]|uniref:GDSL esterase/lipase At5g03980-like n=1 Tax=Gossypium hirsutum TaxID=3635 RepID=A0ABM3BF80_GOSHI|nr:GDSL esterase/lipase At5g03980-like [Gossypium hirsutum]